ncbi:MAG: ADP-ribosylglycohydrolase family protein [Anaerolineales bacterium]
MTGIIPNQARLKLEHPFYETIKLDWRPFPRWQGPHPYGAWGSEPGTYTDDMRFRLLAYGAIIEKRGRITAQDWAQYLYRYGMTALGIDCFEPTYSWDGPQKEWAFPWGDYYAGMSSLPRLAALMNSHRPLEHWDAPAGVINACDPDAAAQDGSVTAVAVAAAFQPEATPDSVIGAVFDHPECVTGPGADQFMGRLEALLAIAAKCADVFELYAPYYERFLVPFGVGTELEMIPFALAAFWICKGDPRSTLVGAINVGRDADTIACTAGEIAGAYSGCHAFPAEWVETTLRVNPVPDMRKVALQMTEVVVECLQKREAISDSLRRLL